MAGWNFRKRVKIAPGVSVNFSKSGMSTSVGPRGAKVTFGPKGTYLNTGIPGTGLYKRQKIGGGSSTPTSYSGGSSSGSSTGNGCLYSCLFVGLWFVILVIFAMCSKPDESLTSSVFWSAGAITAAIFVLFWLLRKIPTASSEKKMVKKQIEELKETDHSDEAEIIRAHAEYLKNPESELAMFDTTKTLGEGEVQTYEDFYEAFCSCMQMSAVWQLEKSVSNEGTKLWATTSVVKKAVSWCVADNRPYIQPCPCPAFNTLADGPIYFFPTFIMHFKNDAHFDIWDYNQVRMSVDYVRFQESEFSAPKDSERLGQTWTYVNKSGGPDRRYSYNPLMEILKYGVVKLETPIGSFTYYTSQYNCVEKMVEAYNHLKQPTTHFTSQETTSTKTTQEEAPAMKPTTKVSSGITRQYFNDISEAVKRLYDFVNKQYETEEMQKILSTSTIELDLGGGIITDKKKILQTLLLTDMISGHLKMGHSLNTKEPHAFGLLLYYYMMETGEELKYEGIRLVKSDLYSSYNDVLNNIAKPIKNQPNHELVFNTARLLNSCGNDALEAFKVSMFRYFSLASKGDGVVKPVEEAFLSVVMRISDNGSTSVEDKTHATENEKRSTLTPKPVSTAPLKALNELIGLSAVKQEVETLTNFIKIQQMRAQKGLKSSSVSYHCVFTGNPGTGKTTVARIVASIYKDMGILKKGHLVETDRAGLVAEYVGQTAVKTNKKIDEALDGVLFIDEAYSLIGEGQDYGKEAIATLLKRMEDDRDRLVVILAGYTNEMKQFIDTNPGLQSRFNRYIDFPDYSADELLQIFESNLKKYEYTMTEDARAEVQKFFVDSVNNKDKNFGNARFVRNTFEKTLERQANRLASVSNLTSDKLSLIEVEDLPC